jgi:hypothetical protein
MSAARGHEAAAGRSATLRVHPDELARTAALGRSLGQQLESLGARIESGLGAAGHALPGSALAAAMRQAGSRYRALLQAESERLDGLVRALAGASHSYASTEATMARAAGRR